MFAQPADPLAVHGVDVQRAATWLARRGAPGQPTRLLAARLAARNATRQLELVLITLCAFVIIGWALLVELIDFSLEVGQAGTDLRGPVEMAVFYLLLAGVTWWVARRQRGAERRIADALPRRAAHGGVRGVPSVLGGWYLVAAAVTYPGGIVIGGAAAVFADAPVNRVLGAIFAVGTLAVGLVAAVVAAEAVRRPALAEDDDSLAADDLLRTEDAHRVAPFPLFVALVAAVNAAVGAPLMWVLLGYVALGVTLWTVTLLVDQRRTLPRPSTARASR